MSRRFRPPAAIEDALEGRAVGELSTDALHMTSPLRVGRRVGRTIYAQLGPEPSDVDPLVATADSPVLAERIVRAVNAAACVAREDTASPDEAARTAPCPDCGADAAVLDSIPSLAPVIDDHQWLGVLCSGSGATVSRPAPAQPTEAPDAQRAAPARDALVRAFFDAEVTGDFFADGQVTWHKPEEAEAERMADVALGVLRGGGADGSGEDDDVADPCMEDAHGTCQAPGHDWHKGQRRRSSSPALAATTPTTSAYQRGTVAKAHELVTSAARQCVPTTPLRSTLERAATLLNGHRCAGEGNVGDEHPAVEALREALDYAGDDRPLMSSHIVDRLSTVKDTVARLEPWPVRGDGKGPQAPSAEEEAIGDLRDHLGLPKETPPSFVAAEAEMRAMPPTSTTTTAPLLRPDVLGKDAKWHERTDHSSTAIAIWLSEDDGAVWVTEDGEIAARSRYSGHYVSEWHGEAITAAHRWREDEMPVARGEVVSGKRAENAPHGTTLVRVDETGRAFAGSSVIETDGGFNGSPTGRYRVLDLPEVRVGTSGGES